MEYYNVGGSIRDKILGVKNKDIDITVTGATSEEMEKMHGPAHGATFGVHSGFVPGHEHLGKVDLAMARSDKKIQGMEGHKAFTVDTGPHVSIHHDLHRRDFTMNAIAENMKTGERIDPFGGEKDIKAGIIKHVSDESFNQDPLRILRMSRFSAQKNFRIHPDTMKLAQKVSPESMKSLSPERIWGETEKALMSSHPHKYFESLHEAGHLKTLFPELHALKGVTHGNHTEDAFDHTMMVLKEGRKQNLPSHAMYGLLNHDLGKGMTPQSEWPRHHGHENNSVVLSNQMSDRLKVPGIHKSTAGWFAENHMKMHKIGEMTPATLTSFSTKVYNKKMDPHMIEGMAKSDAYGRTVPEYGKVNYSRLSQAHDVIKNVSAEPIVAAGHTGPKVGQMLHERRVQAVKDNNI